jgi:hypothetical protein
LTFRAKVGHRRLRIMSLQALHYLHGMGIHFSPSQCIGSRSTTSAGRQCRQCSQHMRTTAAYNTAAVIRKR